MKDIIKNRKLILSIFTLALPAIIEMSLHTLLGIVDTIMISRIIGLEGLSAAGFANQLIFTVIFIFSSFNAGATAMISRSFGEKNMEKLNKVLGQNLFLNIIIGTVITILSIIFSPNLLRIFDISEDVFQLAVPFFRIIAAGMIFMFISFAAKASLRGASDTKTPMIITSLVNLINIIGNYVLMTGFWIFPELGLNGAAISTTFARFIDAALFLLILLRGKGGLQLTLLNLKITREIFKPLWRLSSSAAIEQILMQLSFLVSGIFISQLDTLQEGSFRILLNIESISFMPAIGFSIAAASLVGKSLGEKDVKKSLHIGYTASILGATWGVLMGIIFFTFPVFILKFFTKDVTIINTSLFTMYVMGLNQVPLAFWIVISGALRGAGDTRGVMIISSLRLWLMFIPLCYLFTIQLNFGIAGLWFAELSSFLVFNYIMHRRFKAKQWAKIAL
ncbi:MATE family efflux transporter [Anoxybacter fermentans]|uniref:Probable multidrug resistance protein NorM n=1 Tax=Anoxybacter fermentans TaxID=1323375 RepID=A0A3Q9HPU3_9FIRM|nr:MATE family efflux transporter [Anoxybacter fermentans]AZR72825.1 MATE family efflux transporter [Anoxybacter fermentans]